MVFPKGRCSTWTQRGLRQKRQWLPRRHQLYREWESDGADSSEAMPQTELADLLGLLKKEEPFDPNMKPEDDSEEDGLDSFDSIGLKSTTPTQGIVTLADLLEK